MNYYSQIGQDKYYVEEVIKFRKGGVFLDVGANNGLFESNTYALESQLNWTGVCVEANTDLVPQLKQNRPNAKIVEAAAWHTSGEVEFEITDSQKDNIPGHLLSRVTELQGNDSYFNGHFIENRKTVKVRAKTITEILSESIGVPCVVDYMSLDTEGAELAALQGIDFSCIDIRFMTVEHGNRPGRIQEFETYLKPYGYVLHRVNNWDVEFCKKHKPFSWDCFDTLVFRRLKTPESVFQIIEKKLGLPGFTHQRKEAEKRASNTIFEIYRELALFYNWTEEEKIKNLELEVATEIEECFPVVENTSKLSSGDIVVSDMYLAEEHIKKILNSCGVRQDLSIYVSSNGKHDGWIWNTLPEVIKHTGDNYHSDVLSAERNNIKAVHYTATLNFTENENLVGGDLALFMRMLRLLNPYAPGDTRAVLWEEQTQFNIPALILISLELPKENLAFVHRDCVHLQPIHEALYGIKNNEFHCSRKALMCSDIRYLDYVHSVAYNKTIVDLQGTGKTLVNYWEKSFGVLPKLLYVTGTITVNPPMISIASDILERFNSSNLGTLTDWPNRKENEFNKNYLEAQHAAVLEAIKQLKAFKFSRDKKALGALITRMHYAETPKIMGHLYEH